MTWSGAYVALAATQLYNYFNKKSRPITKYKNYKLQEKKKKITAQRKIQNNHSSKQNTKRHDQIKMKGKTLT